jgi:murein L,D-transpeptidase YcbB/YkuD
MRAATEGLPPFFFRGEMIVNLCKLPCVALLAWCSATQAADENGQFAIKGMGLLPCQDYVQARKEQTPQYFQFGGWMEGYLSATNRYEKDTFDLTPWQTSGVLASWLESFCERNPEVQFVRAVATLVNVLGKDRLTTRSELVEFEANGGTHSVYASTLRRAQQELVKRGLSKDTMSGKLDEETVAALRRFQAESGLEATGLPDPATLARLLQ